MGIEANSVAGYFGENLRLHRRRASLSQEGLGERADLHRTAIGLLERGARVPRIDTVVKLASTLSIRPGELLDGIKWSLDSDQPGGFELRSSGKAGKA